MSNNDNCNCLSNEGCDICDPEGMERLNQRNNGRPLSQGAIRGNKKRGRYGRVVVNRDGSMTLYNVVLENIVVRDCDLIAESGENAIPFADRMNQLEDWSSQEDGATPLFIGGTGGEKVAPGDEKVAPGDERDVFNREQAESKANARLRADFAAEAAE
jgi:hypothetical protein